MNIIVAVFLLCCSSTIVFCQQSANRTGQLICRHCENAKTIDECTSSAVCGQDQECFMDEIITEDFSIIHNAGCRHKTECNLDATKPLATLIGKRNSGLIACSRCCSNADDCNTWLPCASSLYPSNTTQCYSCGGLPSQSQVESPKDCVTLGTCERDKVCYAQSVVIAGKEEIFYGCESKEWCQSSMNRTIANMERCEVTEGDPALCNGEQRAAAAVCQVCCADHGCNNGSCKDLMLHFYSLYKQNLFDIETMKTLAGPTAAHPATVRSPTGQSPSPHFKTGHLASSNFPVPTIYPTPTPFPTGQSPSMQTKTGYTSTYPVPTTPKNPIWSMYDTIWSMYEYQAQRPTLYPSPPTIYPVPPGMPPSKTD